MSGRDKDTKKSANDSAEAPGGGPAAAHRYCSMYCEENVWHLCGDAQVPDGPRAAVFISNRQRSVAVAQQRLAVVPGFPIVWDYHVVMTVRTDGRWHVWDLDCVLGLHIEVEHWLDASFGGGFGFGSQYAPLFRVVPGAVYRERLSSDRSHMRNEDGDYQATPPTWPTIGGEGNNLMAFVSMEQDFVGEVVDQPGLVEALDRSVGSAGESSRSGVASLVAPASNPPGRPPPTAKR
ncbi:MAG: hypothetical protein AAF721_38570, partial [Myxococcota bacterium]